MSRNKEICCHGIPTLQMYVITQNLESRKKSPSFACRLWRLGTPVAIAGHHCVPFRINFGIKKRLLILSERFRVIIVLNHFGSL